VKTEILITSKRVDFTRKGVRLKIRESGKPKKRQAAMEGREKSW
jgi:hypothetical protein